LFFCVRIFGSWVCVVVVAAAVVDTGVVFCGLTIMGVSERTSLTVSSSSGGGVLVAVTLGLWGCGGEW